VPVAGKTGTTNDNTDVWFVGLTPEIVAGVWLGFDRPTSIAPGVAGGSLAAPVFGEMLAHWYRGRAGSSGASRRAECSAEERRWRRPAGQARRSPAG